jgi:hypothetical protein
VFVHVCSVYVRVRVCAFICFGDCQHVRLSMLVCFVYLCLYMCACYHVCKYVYAVFKSASMFVRAYGHFHRARVCSRMYLAVSRTPTAGLPIQCRALRFPGVCVFVCV